MQETFGDGSRGDRRLDLSDGGEGHCCIENVALSRAGNGRGIRGR